MRNLKISAKAKIPTKKLMDRQLYLDDGNTQFSIYEEVVDANKKVINRQRKKLKVADY